MTLRLTKPADKIAIELHDGGLDGAFLETDQGSIEDLGPPRADGSYSRTTTTNSAFECRSPAGTYGNVIRAASSGAVLATGEFSIGN